MKRIALLLLIFFPLLIIGQSSKDINAVIQKTIDLYVLQEHYTEDEKKGKIPLIIINEDKIPNNLIVFKFNKRVKIMTMEELEAFKSISKGNFNSYFVFEIMEFKENTVNIKATFRKIHQVKIDVNLKKENNSWIVVESKAG